jgi:Putative peptidoglycan binding domain
MAVIKKGSKGRDVEEIQKLLNKAKASPKLKVDGIFGSLTDEQVRKFQKKCKLKADGMVGEKTMATLKFGSPLPDMKVQDYAKRKTQFQKTWHFNKNNIESYESIEQEVAKLAEVTAKEVPLAKNLFIENHKQWIIIVEMVDKIVSNQADFDKLRTKDPAKAAKLATECEDLDKKIEGLGASKIKPNLAKALASLDAAQKKINSTLSLIQSEMAAIKKRKADF